MASGTENYHTVYYVVSLHAVSDKVVNQLAIIRGEHDEHYSPDTLNQNPEAAGASGVAAIKPAVCLQDIEKISDAVFVRQPCADRYAGDPAVVAVGKATGAALALKEIQKLLV